MKIKKTTPLYKQRKSAVSLEAVLAEPASATEPMIMRETAVMPEIGLTIPVRAAKAKLSALLELVAGGREVTITSDGKPKAVLSPVGKPKARKVFLGMGDHLKSMPPWRGGPTAEEIIREDRDGRGW